MASCLLGQVSAPALHCAAMALNESMASPPLMLSFTAHWPFVAELGRGAGHDLAGGLPRARAGRW